MGIRDVLNKDQGLSLQGTLPPEGTPLPAGFPRRHGLQDATLPVTSATLQPFAPVASQGPAAQARRTMEETQEQTGGFIGDVVRVGVQAGKGALSVLHQFDRPLQANMAGILKLLDESDAKSYGQAVSAGFQFEDPVSGDAKDDILPSEIVNAVGKKLLGDDQLYSRFNGPTRFAIDLGLYIGLDPLTYTGVGLYAKGLNTARKALKLKSFYKALTFAKESRYQITRGKNITTAAHVITNEEIRDINRALGKDDGVLGETMMRIAEDLKTDEELEIARDFLTGLGVKNAVSGKLAALIDSGKVSAKQATQIMRGALSLPLGKGDVEHIAKATSRLVGETVGRPVWDLSTLRRVSVGVRGPHGFEIRSLYDGPSEFITGQLINKFGMMPTDAVNPKIIQSARDLIKSESTEKVIDAAAKKLSREDLAGIWNGVLSQADRLSVLEKNRHLTAKGKVSKVRQKASDLASTLIDSEEAGNKILGQLSSGEKRALIEKALRKPGAFSVEGLVNLQAKRKGTDVLAAVFGKAGIELPDTASDAYRAAQLRALQTGPYVHDMVSGALLAQRFARMGIVDEGVRDLAYYASGIKNLKDMSSVPEIMSHPGVMESMMDTGDWSTRTWGILNGILDVSVTLPKPMYEALHFAESMMHGEANLLARMLEKQMVYQGQPIRRNSELSQLIAKGLDGDTVALDRLRTYDANGEAMAVFHSFRAFFDGMAERMTRLGFSGFERGSPLTNSIIKDKPAYFPRIYPELEESLAKAVEMGVITERDAASIRRSMQAKGRNWHAFFTPQEIDFVKANRVYFKHLEARKFTDPLPDRSWDLHDALRAYLYGAMRKVHLEPAIKRVNAAAAGGSLPIDVKQNLNSTFKAMLGIETDMERRINDTIEVIANRFGLKLKPRAATRASLFITRRFYDGLLGWNVGFMLKNLTQGINTSTVTGPLHALKGVTMLADPALREERAARNLLSDFKQIFESDRFSGHSWGYKLKNILYWPATFSETFNRGVAFNAGVSQRIAEMVKAGQIAKKDAVPGILAKKHPKLWHEVVNFGHNIANETQFIYGVLGRSPAAGTPVGRLGLQFFSWPVKQAQFLASGTWGKDAEGIEFLLNYTLLCGFASRIAERSLVDSGDFIGFGFTPTNWSPTFQLVSEAFMSVHAMTEGDREAEREHTTKLAEQLTMMIPAANQLQKMMRAEESREEGVTRGFRERAGRSTGGREGLLHPLLEATNLDQVISDEQFIQYLGLPTIPARETREALEYIDRRRVEEDRKARRYVDEYIQAKADGDFHKPYEIILKAQADGVPITEESLNRELIEKITPNTTRALDAIRLSQRARIEDEVEKKFPNIRRYAPPLIMERPADGARPDSLGNTGALIGGRVVRP